MTCLTPELDESAASVAVYVPPGGTGAHDPSTGLGAINFGFEAQLTFEVYTLIKNCRGTTLRRLAFGLLRGKSSILRAAAYQPELAFGVNVNSHGLCVCKKKENNNY